METSDIHVAVDIVVFLHNKEQVLLITRKNPPFAGMHALPGGFVASDEHLIDAAKREFAEETGIRDVKLTCIGVYDAIDRDLRGRVISIAYAAELDVSVEPHAGSDAGSTAWFQIDDLPDLAFDHALIVKDALRARKNI